MPVDPRERLLLIAAFLAVWVIWGSTYLGIAIAIETLPPLVMAGMRFVVAGLLMLAFARARAMAMPDLRQWRAAAIVGVLMLFGGNGLVTLAEKDVPSSIAALLITTVPMWMTLLDAPFYGGRRPGRRAWAGLVLGFVGVGILVRPSGNDLASWPLLGSILLVSASFFWAHGSLLSRKLTLPKAPIVAIGAEMLAGGASMAAAGVLRGELVAFDPAAVSTRSAVAWIYLTIFGSIIAFSAYMHLLRKVSSTAAGTYAFVNPVVAVVLGWWLAGEVITPRVLVAGALILIAVMAILWKPRARVASGRPAAADACEREAHAEA